MTFYSALILLILVIDPLGGIPLFTSALKVIPEGRRLKLVVRECFIAFLILFICLLGGRQILELMHLSQSSLGITGGILLFLISIRIIFPAREGAYGDLGDEEPFIVPLAIPLIAGPSAIATVILLASKYPQQLLSWIAALSLAILLCAVTLAASSQLMRVFGKRGMLALERLLGLVLAAISVQMFLDGIKEFASSFIH